MIYVDQRRIGDHGIGRFARHVLANIDYRPSRWLGIPPRRWMLDVSRARSSDD